MRKAVEAIKIAIKANVEESLSVRKEIHVSRGKKRHSLWVTKRGIGEDTRYLLLAYACFRGKSYVQIEHKVQSGNEPSPKEIFIKIQAFLPQESIKESIWSVDRVKAWLKEETTFEANEEAA